jgi:hypothetical protein
VVAEGCPMPHVRFKQPTPRLSATVVKRDISARPLKRECAAWCMRLSFFACVRHFSSNGLST